MWKIEINKSGTWEHHEWYNKCSDDFIRFLPTQFEIDKSDLKMFTLDNVDYATYKALMVQTEEIEGETQPIHSTDYSESGKIKVKLISDDSLVYTLTGQEVLWDDMYDENMNFLG